MEPTELMAFYKDEYYGEPVDEADFPRLFVRAQETLEALTLGRLYTVDESLMDHVKRALCAQIEYLHMMGVESATVGTSDGSFTTGHVSVSGGSSGGGESSAVTACARAQMHLFPTGLLFRGCVLC